MSLFGLSPFLRRALLADALISGATGLLMLIGANVLASLLGLPEALLRYAGLVLLPYAALVAYVATREQLRRWAVWAVIVANAIWAVDSIILLLSGWLTPNALGYAFITFQALIVAAFAEIQYFGLRRSMTTVA
jgi:glucose uptake protein GlcU